MNSSVSRHPRWRIENDQHREIYRRTKVKLDKKANKQKQYALESNS